MIEMTSKEQTETKRTDRNKPEHQSIYESKARILTKLKESKSERQELVDILNRLQEYRPVDVDYNDPVLTRLFDASIKISIDGFVFTTANSFHLTEALILSALNDLMVHDHLTMSEEAFKELYGNDPWYY